jgi:hypothetical protein
VLCEVASVSEVVHWLMHREPRCLHILQRTSDGDAKIHLTFLRLHSRQLCVPFLTFLCFAELWASILAQAFSSGACTAETCSVVFVACRWHVYHGKVCRALHAISCSRVLSRQTLYVVTEGQRTAVVLTKHRTIGRNVRGRRGMCMCLNTAAATSTSNISEANKVTLVLDSNSTTTRDIEIRSQVL